MGALFLAALIAWFLIRKCRKRSTTPFVNNSNDEPNTADYLMRPPWGQAQSPVSIPIENRTTSTPYTIPNPDDDSSDCDPSVLQQAPPSLHAANVTQHEDSRPGTSNHFFRGPITLPSGPRLNHSPKATDESPPNYSGSTG